jgi:hypothetical protein
MWFVEVEITHRTEYWWETLAEFATREEAEDWSESLDEFLTKRIVKEG